MKDKKTALNASEVKNALDAYRKLEDKAQEILDAGSCGCDDIAGLQLEKDGSVEVSYWTSCRGEHYIEAEHVPIEWFGYGEQQDLEKLWEEKRIKARLVAEKAAKLEEKWRKAEEKKRELAELKRLKAKYPNA